MATGMMPALLLALGAPTAAASGDDWGLNGTYAATSIGNWAQTNDVYRDEATVRSKWTIPRRAAPRSNAPDGSSATSGGART